MQILFDGLAPLETSLAYHRDRHAVLAGNLANVETPGYRALDVVPGEPPTAADSLNKTDVRHLDPTGSVGTSGEIIEMPGRDPRDGNAISMERELAKLDANRVRYLASSTLVSRRLALLKYTAGDGG